MSIKLTTPLQVAQLRIGDIVRRFPSGGSSENTLDETRPGHIDTFRILSINMKNEMVGLVMTGESAKIFSSPGNIGRLFIKSYNLIAEKIWWI
ncbi:hypothetical protein ACTHGU_01105 [Chitinophagaceae bacterium MMS25-I14]